MPSSKRNLTTLLSVLLFNMVCGLQSSFPPRNTKVGWVSSRTDTVSSTHVAAKIDTIDPTLRAILQYTTMAPSSHNTQCWKFRIEDSRCVNLVPDMDRACPVVDPDDHHLYVTLGCAVENFVIAARAFGFETQVKLETPVQSKGIRLQLSPCRCEDTDLFQAIPKRQVTRCEYDGTSLTPEELAELQAAGTSTTCPGVFMILKTKQGDDDCLGRIQDLILQANTEQLSNPDFKQELASWVRFNDKEAAEKGDGLLGKCTGNPSAPRWVGNLILQHIVRPSLENAKIKKQMASSAGIAVFVSTQNDPVHWIEVGRCYERFALKATAMGIKNAFLNQPVEEAQFRKLLVKELGLEDENNTRPDLLVRFGRGPTMPYSPRRPLEDVVAFQVD